LIDLLIDVPGFDLNAKQDSAGNTAAHLYLKKSDIRGWRSILRSPGFDSTAVNNEGDTLLHSAVKSSKNLSLLWPELSIETSSSYHLQYSEIGVDCGMTQINAQNKAAQTALHIAVEQEALLTVKQLLIHPKMNPNLKDRHQQSALHIAVNKNIVLIVDLLLEKDRVAW